jgi:threonine dehydrogenase-like Zn-dependent dehydrogenase
LGYCAVGYVERLGDGVTGLEAGQAVIAMGWEYAVHAEYINVPWKLVVKVAEGTDLRCALFANLMATSMHALDRAELLGSDRALVIGAGLVGRLTAMAARAVTSNVWITDTDSSRLSIPATEKVEVTPSPLVNQGEHAYPYTKAFICSRGDATELLQTLVHLLDPRGNGVHRPRIVGVGRYSAKVEFSVEQGNLDMVYVARCGEGYRNDDYVHGRLALQPLPGEHTVDQNLQRALDLIVDGKVDPSTLISRVVPLGDALDVYRELEHDSSLLGVLIEYPA